MSVFFKELIAVSGISFLIMGRYIFYCLFPVFVKAAVMYLFDVKGVASKISCRRISTLSCWIDIAFRKGNPYLIVKTVCAFCNNRASPILTETWNMNITERITIDKHLIAIHFSVCSFQLTLHIEMRNTSLCLVHLNTLHNRILKANPMTDTLFTFLIILIDN